MLRASCLVITENTRSPRKKAQQENLERWEGSDRHSWAWLLSLELSLLTLLLPATKLHVLDFSGGGRKRVKVLAATRKPWSSERTVKNQLRRKNTWKQDFCLTTHQMCKFNSEIGHDSLICFSIVCYLNSTFPIQIDYSKGGKLNNYLSVQGQGFKKKINVWYLHRVSKLCCYLFIHRL